MKFASHCPRVKRRFTQLSLASQEQISAGRVSVKHRAGVDNLADLFTKCVSTKEFFKHRLVIGVCREMDRCVI